ncbi:hypothetical protein ECG_07567 [Echinococcus granulosus]|nr:hypothetical protein ECG_07567 [Echinococcus granulosus]
MMSGRPQGSHSHVWRDAPPSRGMKWEDRIDLAGHYVVQHTRTSAQIECIGIPTSFPSPLFFPTLDLLVALVSLDHLHPLHHFVVLTTLHTLDLLISLIHSPPPFLPFFRLFPLHASGGAFVLHLVGHQCKACFLSRGARSLFFLPRNT